MFNKDYIVMLVRTAFQFIGLAATLKPDFFQGVDLLALENSTVSVVGGVVLIVSTAHMLYSRFATKVVDAK